MVFDPRSGGHDFRYGRSCCMCRMTRQQYEKNRDPPQCDGKLPTMFQGSDSMRDGGTRARAAGPGLPDVGPTKIP
jgi:hypothetical protein